MLDVSSTTAIVGVLCTVIGAGIRSVFSAGQKESGLTTTVDNHGKRLDEHGKRLGEHDSRFAQLGTEFVPRPEVERAITSIESSQKRSEQLLLHLVTSRPVKADVE